MTLATPQGPLTFPTISSSPSPAIIPTSTFIERLGVTLDEANDRCPVCDPATLESNVPGIYLAGVIVAGERTNEIFIENGRFHGELIAEDLRGKLEAVPALADRRARRKPLIPSQSAAQQERISACIRIRAVRHVRHRWRQRGTQPFAHIDDRIDEHANLQPAQMYFSAAHG